MFGRQLRADTGDLAVLDAFENGFEASSGALVWRCPDDALPLVLLDGGEVRGEAL